MCVESVPIYGWSSCAAWQRVLMPINSDVKHDRANMTRMLNALLCRYPNRLCCQVIRAAAVQLDGIPVWKVASLVSHSITCKKALAACTHSVFTSYSELTVSSYRPRLRSR